MIRKYVEADIDAKIDVWFKASKLATPFLSDEFLEQEKYNIRNIYSKFAETWIAEYEGKLVGFIALIDNEVGAIFVDPDYHGKKIGKALMDKAIELRGDVFLDVFKKNHIGQKFYFSYGFKKDHEHIHKETGEELVRLVFSPK